MASHRFALGHILDGAREREMQAEFLKHIGIAPGAQIFFLPSAQTRCVAPG